MGYSTDFSGELKFKTELTATLLAKVKSFMGEDCREHPEWNTDDLTHIDLEILDDFSGIRWDGSEKTYDLVEKINLITTEMRKSYPEFELIGEMLAQGENIEDRWILKMVDGIAERKEIILTGKKVTCPHCEEEFMLEE